MLAVQAAAALAPPPAAAAAGAPAAPATPGAAALPPAAGPPMEAPAAPATLEAAAPLAPPWPSGPEGRALLDLLRAARIGAAPAAGPPMEAPAAPATLEAAALLPTAGPLMGPADEEHLPLALAAQYPPAAPPELRRVAGQALPPPPALPYLAWASAPRGTAQPGDLWLKCLLCDKWVWVEEDHSGTPANPAGTKLHRRRLWYWECYKAYVVEERRRHHPVAAPAAAVVEGASAPGSPEGASSGSDGVTAPYWGCFGALCVPGILATTQYDPSWRTHSPRPPPWSPRREGVASGGRPGSSADGAPPPPPPPPPPAAAGGGAAAPAGGRSVLLLQEALESFLEPTGSAPAPRTPLLPAAAGGGASASSAGRGHVGQGSAPQAPERYGNASLRCPWVVPPSPGR